MKGRKKYVDRFLKEIKKKSMYHKKKERKNRLKKERQKERKRERID